MALVLLQSMAHEAVSQMLPKECLFHRGQVACMHTSVPPLQQLFKHYGGKDNGTEQ